MISKAVSQLCRVEDDASETVEPTAPVESDAPAKPARMNGSGEAEPEKRRGGKQKGAPKTGGRTKPLRYLPGRRGREEIAERSGVLDFLAKMCAGKAVKTKGPTGKAGWHHPSIEDRRWAAGQLLPRVLPALAIAQVGQDPDSEPVNDQPDNLELARRVARLLTLATSEKKQPEPKQLPASAKAQEAQPEAADSPTPDKATTAPGDSPRPASDTSEPEAEPPPEPAVPQPGESVCLGSFIIRCEAPSRPGLPDGYAIFNDCGALMTRAVGGWLGALEWVGRQLGQDADELAKQAPHHEAGPALGAATSRPAGGALAGVP